MAPPTNGNGRLNQRWTVQGMTALVTGGTKGLGKGFKVTGSVCDVSSRIEREKLINQVSSLFDGKLNILINNVGTTIRKATVEFTAEDFSFLMATNFESAYNLCQLAHPLLKASGAASIVLMSSVCGVVAVVDVGSISGATKGAMNHLARILACEWAQDNIRTNSVTPWEVAFLSLSAVELMPTRLHCSALRLMEECIVHPVKYNDEGKPTAAEFDVCCNCLAQICFRL
ncbi:hypothetical protein WN944_028125 [Citrus x changshan-huyou]|uniref:Uncharacterized protein n=1 Tax=Citrus x changshan-huyou TaxID=2935761 RepID=A0AAP0LL97_9ROSI